MQKLNVDFLEELRDEKLMTVTDFAVEAGISAATYVKIGSGCQVTNTTTQRMIEHLKLNKSQINRLLNSTQ